MEVLLWWPFLAAKQEGVRSETSKRQLPPRFFPLREMDVLRTLTKDSNIKDVSKEALDEQARADAAFSTRMCVEARMLAERDANTGKARGWAWQTRVDYDKGVHHPYANYTGYLRNEASPFWPQKDTKKLKQLYKQ
jgi:hypothetical protein